MNTIYQQQKKRALTLFDTALSIARQLNKKEIETELLKSLQKLNSDQLSVVIAGECKRGKSSLVNNLLEEKVCPVNAAVTTCLVSTIRYGEHEKITVYTQQENGAVNTKEITRQEIVNYATQQQNPDNQKNVTRLDIQIPNSHLADGLVFVDTPGIGGLNVNHSYATFTFIPNADTVLYVCDATSPLSQNELEYIKRVADKCKNLIFVITRKDLVPDLRGVIAENRTKLATTFGREPGTITIVAISNLAKENYLAEKDPEDIRDSNFEELENVLWNFLQRERGRIILSRALGVQKQAVSEMAMPLTHELQTFYQQDQAEAERQKNELQAQHNRRTDLLSGRVEWQSLLSKEIGIIKINTQHDLRSGFTSIDNELNHYVKDTQLQREPEQIASLLAADLSSLMSNIDHTLNSQASSLYQKLIDETGLTLAISGYSIAGQVNFDSQVTIQNRQDILSKVFTVSRQAFFNGTIGGGLGSLFPGPGTVIGAAVGMIHGLFEGIRQVKKSGKANTSQQLSEYFRPQLLQAQNDCERNVSLTLMQIETDIREEFRKQIERELRLCEESINAINKAQKTHAEKAKTRIAEIEKVLGRLNELQQSILQLESTLPHQENDNETSSDIA
ncbi:MAG: dynamin family protein [Firmicutes bacterium]|nr:dynamin family protein [Bacillota bacterium]